MTKGPQWMPLDVGDYLKATHHLSVAEHGAYLLLIMHYWQDGGLPSDERMIARLSHLTAEQWIESRDVLAALFNEGWKHKRVEAELAKASDIIDKRKQAGKLRHSTSSTHAEQVDSTSSYAGVPPSPSPLVIEPPASVPEPGARDLFLELVEAFPQNPSSSETKARTAFERIKPAERPDVVAAAQRYSQWFARDCEERGRTLDAGLRYVPHLGTWLDKGEWREAAKLPLKGAVGPVVPMVRLDRDRDHALWVACEKIMGKPVPTSGMEWSFRAEIVEQARAAA